MSGEKSGTVVPMTSEDKVIFDPHDYDEVPMDESRSPPPLPPAGLGKPPTPTTPTPTFHERPLPPDPTPQDGYTQVSQTRISPLPQFIHPHKVEENSEGKIPDYAELKDPPPRQSVLQTGMSAEGVKSGSVSRAKFDLVKDKLKKVQVWPQSPPPT